MSCLPHFDILSPNRAFFANGCIWPLLINARIHAGARRADSIYTAFRCLPISITAHDVSMLANSIMPDTAFELAYIIYSRA